MKQIAGFGLVEWSAFFGFWILFESQLNLYELLYGAGAALVATIGFEIIRAHHLTSFRPRLGWVLEGWRLPWYVLEGCWTVTLALLKQAFKPHKSVLRSVVFAAGGSDASSGARRALTIGYTTMPPNFVVLSIDLDKNVMVVHQVEQSSTPRMTKNLGAKS